uniref:Testis cDNA clone: QtsA-14178, similar to human acidic repeat containing (ACRC) n=1 Tax=Macaca fascicularis TaxID=9541 RepID=Q4R7X4_MACFA|nr:unnamed protein product [Macaca fascicularis]
MDGYKEELPRLQDPEEDEDCYILNVQSSSDDTNGSSVARTVPRRQVSCILNVRSRSGDTNGSSVTRRALKRQASCILNVRSRSGDTNGSSVTRRPPKRQAISVVVIDSDSDDECYTYEEKICVMKARLPQMKKSWVRLLSPSTIHLMMLVSRILVRISANHQMILRLTLKFQRESCQLRKSLHLWWNNQGKGSQKPKLLWSH